MADGQARTALVTGAAGRAGRALALGLAARGDRVVAADRDVAGARETVALIEADGGTALAVGVDVTVLNSARALALTAADFSGERGGGGRIDVVINAASDAGADSAPFTEVDVDEWDRLMAVNLKGPWLVTRACSRFLPPGGKVVILCAAVAGGSARAVHSAASEGGVIALARALAEELRGRGVTVNAVVPGAGEPDDIVGAALFLAGPGSARITGQALVVDDGRPFG
ncbi:SDR family NAD(P)-dependent oxidoreductase [Cryobacterium tagatosivorans]|uniref:SDR family oxidoreductase n=1 Tax=Cryobacterium tagatosivorans TaxID=1259199 RepID=A0A4R8UFC5_9MICO|nr:SDR family oxidoreductase [Cryobacterium tagatosivorans]TFB49895.1 SDR family oxidoreductase [Cryobacterium tagatosivorans]